MVEPSKGAVRLAQMLNIPVPPHSQPLAPELAPPLPQPAVTQESM
jgi:hypothetical protein